MKKVATVDEYIENATNWKSEMSKLRELALECNLIETIKWGVPCYTYNDKNILLIGPFKDHCVLSFVKGALLQDAAKLLVFQGENSRSVKVLKVTNSEVIDANKDTLKAYIFEAIELEKAGISVEKLTDIDFIAELQETMDTNEAFKEAFLSLTPGRQRAYNMFFEAAKQTKTRYARIESNLDRILNRKGLNDCVCGHSKKMPSCDGSHKYL